MKRIVVCFIFAFMALGGVRAQTDLSPFYVNGTVYRGDTIPLYFIRDVYVFPRKTFRSKKQEAYYWRMVRDVKITLPYAKMVYATLIETYEFMMTLPNDRAREKHIKKMEKEIWNTYSPVLKRFSYSQGKLLIRLIDRECNQTSYALVRAFMGSTRAFFWNAFATMFGASLKSPWDPDGKDADLERICLLVEQGTL